MGFCVATLLRRLRGRLVALVVALATALAPAAPAGGQGGSALRAGDWVRVDGPGPGRPLEGQIVAVDTVGITIWPADDAPALLQLRYQDARTIEVRLAQLSPGEGAARGAGIGFLVGAIPGVLVTGAVLASDADETCGDCFFPPTAAAAVLSAAFTAVTTVSGAVLGALRPPARWARVRPPLRITAAPASRGRVALGAGVRF
jgi:hypothetical protein